ncbi:MAG TPA: hypothetical protein VN939_22075 [Chthoniobacterales bacterium]|nr:hypothetical protein [Chthoniobacterales bacterium]
MSQSELTITLTPWTSTTLGAGWEVINVVAHLSDGEQNSFMVARDGGGNIIEKTDVILERWEALNDEEGLQCFRRCFAESDRLANEKTVNTENG